MHSGIALSLHPKAAPCIFVHHAIMHLCTNFRQGLKLFCCSSNSLPVLTSQEQSEPNQPLLLKATCFCFHCTCLMQASQKATQLEKGNASSHCCMPAKSTQSVTTQLKVVQFADQSSNAQSKIKSSFACAMRKADATCLDKARFLHGSVSSQQSEQKSRELPSSSSDQLSLRLCEAFDPR